jgi:apolipoprotein N-acyltransferase
MGLPHVVPWLEPLAPVSAVPVLLLARRLRERHLRFAYLAGFSVVFTGLSWLHHVSSIAVVMLAGYFGAYVGVAVLVSGPLARAWKLPVWAAAPLAILTAEGLCQHVTIFDVTWLFQGYMAWRWTELMQVAEWGGIGFVSALIWFVAGGIVHLWEKRATWKAPSAWAPLAASVAVVTLLALAGAWRIESLAMRPGPTVALVQGNVPMARKLDPAQVPDMLMKHLRMTLQLQGQAIDLVAWPETAAMMALENEPQALMAIGLAAARVDAPVITGAFGINPDHDPPAPSNSAFLVSRRGVIEGRQDKRVLVPGAETLLFLDRIEPVRDALGELLSRRMGFRPYLVAGDHAEVLQADDIQVGALICYGDLVPVPAEELQQAGAEILLTLSNEAWFGARELDQHLAMAVVRSIETRLPMGRSTNTGISCVIDPAGRVVERLPRNEAGVLVSSFPVTDARPAPAWMRRVPQAVAVATTLLLTLVAWRRSRRAAAQSPAA